MRYGEDKYVEMASLGIGVYSIPSNIDCILRNVFIKV